MRAVSFGAVGVEPAMRFGQRRLARGVAVDLAFGIGVAFARGVGLALRGAPRIARGGLRSRGDLQFGLGGLQRLALGGGLGAGLLEFALDIDQPRPLGESPRRAGRRMRRRDKTVPAPDVAFQRHQPLAGLQLRHQFGAAFLGDDADLRQTARQFGGRIDHAKPATSTPAGREGSPSVTPELVQRIGADGSTGASRSSPSTAPIAFSYPLATVTPSMIGGHKFLVSPLTSFEIVRASVSSRCTRLSASFSGAREDSSFCRAAT